MTLLLALPVAACGGSVSSTQTTTPFQAFKRGYEQLRGPLNQTGDAIGTDLTAIVAAAETHSASAGEQAGASLVTDARELRSAAATIKAKLGIT